MTCYGKMLMLSVGKFSLVHAVFSSLLGLGRMGLGPSSLPCYEIKGSHSSFWVFHLCENIFLCCKPDVCCFCVSVIWNLACPTAISCPPLSNERAHAIKLLCLRCHERPLGHGGPTPTIETYLLFCFFLCE